MSVRAGKLIRAGGIQVFGTKRYQYIKMGRFVAILGNHPQRHIACVVGRNRDTSSLVTISHHENDIKRSWLGYNHKQYKCKHLSTQPNEL